MVWARPHRGGCAAESVNQEAVMLHDTIAKIESKLQNSQNMSAERKAELLDLLNTLRAEVNELSKTERDKAQSIVGFAEISAHEAIRDQKNPELLDLSLKGFSSSVTEFEKSHPRLVQIVNRISTMLSNMGI
jgi:hypothetical protein